MDFTLLIVGADANAYYMARCYHERYNKKAFLIATKPIWFTSLSEIVDIKYYENLWEEREFLRGEYTTLSSLSFFGLLFQFFFC